MLCQWKAGTWTAVIVALVVAISVANQPEPRTPIVTIEEVAQ
jgi:hypothetical protein